MRRVRHALWRQAGVQYCWRRIGVKGRAQTGQGVVPLSLRISLRVGGIGWPSFVVGRADRGGRSGVGAGVASVGFGADTVAGVGVRNLWRHDARAAGATCSAADGRPAGGLGTARALAVVRVSSCAVRAWIWRWIAAGFRVG